jgi:hypothetical protein
MTAVVTKMQTTMTETRTSTREIRALSERRTKISAITNTNAANAPAKGAGSTSGVESSPFADALSAIDMDSSY